MTASATDVVMASSLEDSRAVEAVKNHHAELAGRLAAHVDALLSAASGPLGTFADARAAAVRFCTTELAPHAQAEEDTLYPAAARVERARLLVEGMVAEHQVIHRLVAELRDVPDPVRAAAAGHALRVLFEAHLQKENDLVLPVVAADRTVSLATILDGMHELLGHDDEPQAAGGCGGHECSCGESGPAVPELDVRQVPHAIRHATVFGAFDAIGSGASLVLVAPHDPLPLLQQLDARAGGGLRVEYLARGPEAWRLRLTRS